MKSLSIVHYFGPFFKPYKFLAILLIVFTACTKNEGELFSVLDAQKSGVNFRNDLLEDKNLNILDYLYFYNGGGVAIGDINNDDLPDVYFTGNRVKNKLYLNLGNLKFKDITLKSFNSMELAFSRYL